MHFQLGIYFFVLGNLLGYNNFKILQSLRLSDEGRTSLVQARVHPWFKIVFRQFSGSSAIKTYLYLTDTECPLVIWLTQVIYLRDYSWVMASEHYVASYAKCVLCSFCSKWQHPQLKENYISILGVPKFNAEILMNSFSGHLSMTNLT